MSFHRNNSLRSSAEASQSKSTGDRADSARIAHELANLLDGSLRNLGLAISILKEGAQPDDALAHRLQTTNQAMQQMAMLVQRWMQTGEVSERLFEASQTLEQVIEHAAAMLMPVTIAHQIDLEIDIDPQVAQLEAGVLYPVAANVMKNSLEAIVAGEESAPADGWRIEVTAQAADDQLELRVTDNGPGVAPGLLDASGRFRFGVTTKPAGHGLGLALCRDMAQSLGGQLEMTNLEPHGSRFILRCPLKNMRAASSRLNSG